MALTVGIGKNSRSMEYRLAFDPEVFYYVLSPEIDKVYSTTGKLIDLYDGLTFQPHEFVHLKKLISDARVRVEMKPKAWQEFVGRQTHPIGKDLYEKVSKAEVLSFLDKFQQVIDEAELKKLGVVFYGD